MARILASLLLIFVIGSSLVAPVHGQFWNQQVLRDSTYVTQLTHTPADVSVSEKTGAHDPSWSADGKWILYSETDGAPGGRWRIRRMRPDGSDNTVVIDSVPGNRLGGQTSPRPVLSPEGTTKAVFRRAMRGLVPETILSRRDKIGFATPEAAWLKSQHAWVTSILESDAAAQIPAIRPEIMKRDWQNFLQGRSQFDFRFWRWINLIRWAEIREIAFD